jgi:hypothetical protein
MLDHMNGTTVPLIKADRRAIGLLDCRRATRRV